MYECLEILLPYFYTPLPREWAYKKGVYLRGLKDRRGAPTNLRPNAMAEILRFCETLAKDIVFKSPAVRAL
jgi:hypothetical protein